MPKLQKHFLPAMMVAALGLAVPWAGAQTAQPAQPRPMTSSGAGAQGGGQSGLAGQGAPAGAVQTVPLNNPLNRNPARRGQLPDSVPPPDPRDSTTRPAMPPGSDERDTVLPMSDTLQPARPTPALGRP